MGNCGCGKTKIVQVNTAGGIADGVVTGGSYDDTTNELTLNLSTGGSVTIAGVTSGVGIYAADGTLNGARTVDMDGNDITWQNGGDFIIDGKLTVTGLIDPTGLQFSGPQSDELMPNETIYISDGSASGYPLHTFVYKDNTGSYHAMGDADVSTLVSTDTGNTLVTAPGDAKIFAMPITEIECYEETNITLTQQFDGANLVNGNITVGGTSNTKPVIVPQSSFDLAAVDLYTATGSGLCQVEIRTGGVSGPVVAVSDVVDLTGAANDVVTRFLFPSLPAVTAGTPYFVTFLLSGSSPSLQWRFRSGSDSFAETQTSTSAADAQIGFASGVLTGQVQYNVVTYSDGVNVKVIASRKGVPTDVQDVTAGLPAGWTPCP